MNFGYKHIFIYFFITVNIVIGLTAIFRLFEKADLPFRYHSEENKVITAEKFQNTDSGSCISEIDGISVTSEFETEFVLDTKHIGDEVLLTIIKTDSPPATEKVILTKYYKNYSFIIISLITGFLFWLTGVYVFAVRKEDKSARLLCLVLITFSLAIMSTPCHFGRGDDLMGYIIRISHPLSYLAGSIFFLQFTLTFPYSFFKKTKIITGLIYGALVLVSVIVSVVLISAMRDMNEYSLDLFLKLWSVIQLVLLSSILAGTFILFAKYKRLTLITEKSKLEWIFWGISAGVVPFIVFWLIPGIFGFPYIINEEVILALLVIVPVSFAIAVVKHHIFDIEILVKRSVIYLLLVSLTVLLYFGIIYGLSSLADWLFGINSGLLNLVSALFIALIFNPLRLRLNKFVDSVFYREKYFFDKAIIKITDRIKKCDTEKSLGEILIEEIKLFIPVNSIGIYISDESGERLKMLKQINFDELSENIPGLRINKIIQKFNLPFAVKNKVDKGVRYDPNLDRVLKKWNINIAIPMTLKSFEAVGVIILGEKMSELRYSVSDIELLNTIAAEAALAIKRFEVHRKLITEETENIQLKEINELKSYFVSSVSHDLKTPLSAIKIFTELLNRENISREKAAEYIGMIEGETDRLGRMIENILNYNKMEKGIINYTFKRMDLNALLKSVLKRMNYEFTIHKFSVDTEFADNPVFINGDPEALFSLFENLISNSLKYSGENKIIKVRTGFSGDKAEVTIEDKGTGISDDNLEHIFDPYFREKNRGNIKGTGLGLTIVKNITDAHSGKIEVKSKAGCGSIFKIKLPLYNHEQ